MAQHEAARHEAQQNKLGRERFEAQVQSLSSQQKALSSQVVDLQADREALAVLGLLLEWH